MYDRGLSVLEQYGLEVKNTGRGRGALICRTQEHTILLREYGGSPKKLEYQAEFLALVEQEGDILTDIPLKNQDGCYITCDKDNIPYIVKRWYEGRECDTQSLRDIGRSVAALASLHNTMKMPVREQYIRESLVTEYERHNRELRKIRKFVCEKRQKNDFERRYLDSVACFLWHGEEALRKLEASSYRNLREKNLERGTVCHGEFNQHNVMFLPEKTAVVNFDKWNYDVQISDLYQFMRKILEKHNWNPEIGREMLDAYAAVRPLSEEEMENLCIRFSYPEKYWKLANYYYTHSKVWISEKNLEKLEKLIGQYDRWRQFAENLSF
ncbi:MAG: CotS family spore coat protein [Blautia sp.]